MRVSTQALASLAALSFFASCVTPPPVSRPGGGYADYEPRGSAVEARPASYAPAPQRRYDRPPPQDGYYDRDPAGPAGVYTPAPSGRLSLLLGRRNLDDPNFEPTDEPGVLGLEFNQVVPPGSLGFEFGLGFSYDEENNANVPGIGTADLELSQAEIYAGVRAEFGHSNVRPYIGGGGTFMSTTTTVNQGFLEAEEDDSTLGLYLHGGIQADINEAFFLGIDYRHVFGADYEVNGTEFDSGYNQLAFVLGFNL